MEQYETAASAVLTKNQLLATASYGLRQPFELSNETKSDDAHFMCLSFNDVFGKEVGKRWNRIPTTFSLTAEEVDLLFKTGLELLRNNLAFKKD